MKPTFDIGNGTYFGGKGAGGVVHRIINQIPQHHVFISGFLGRCAVMRYKLTTAINIGIDLDSEILDLWKESVCLGANTTFPDLWKCDAGLDFAFWKIDVLDFISDAAYLQKRDTFLYLDPPYLHATRTSSKRYKFEMTGTQHQELLARIKTLPCMVALSCYDSPLYAQELLPWRKIQFHAQTRGGIRMETLYMNYPEPAPDMLHDKRFLGEDFRAREKAKRRIETIKGKINRLSMEEKARLSDWLRGLVAT